MIWPDLPVTEAGIESKFSDLCAVSHIVVTSVEPIGILKCFMSNHLG